MNMQHIWPARAAGWRASGQTFARPALHVTLALLLLVGIAECSALVVSALAYPKVGYDFTSYYSAALALRDNPHADIYNLRVLQGAASAHSAMQPGALYLYPPLLAVLLIPLTLLPYAVALRLWLLLNLLLWLSGTGMLVALLRRALLEAGGTLAGDRPWLRDATMFSVGVCAFLALAYGPLMQAFQLGQVTMLIFVIIVAVPFLLRAGRDRTVGVLVALAALLKLFPAVLILYFALRGRRRVVTSALVAVAGSILALLPLLGLDGLLAAGRVLANGGANAQQFHNQSLARAPLWIAAALGGTPSPALDMFGDALIVLILLAFVAGMWRTLCPRAGACNGHDDLAGYMWAVATMVLAAPIMWGHYDAWLLPVMIVCLGYGMARLVGSGSAAQASGKRNAVLFAAAIVTYVLTANALPFGYDGLTTFSPGPYIAGHSIRPYFMLLRPLAALVLWITTGALYLRGSAGRAPRQASSAPDPAFTPATTSHNREPRHPNWPLALVAIVVPAAVIGMDVAVGLVTSLARP